MKKPSEDRGLKKGALSHIEVFAQSVANIAPSATPALIIPLVFANAGNATWIAYAIATAAMFFVTAQINVFAKRSASPGALYTFTTLGLGKKWGAVSGWSLFLAYVLTGAATIAGFTNYAGVILDNLFHYKVSPILGMVLMVGDISLCWWVAWKDVQLSTRFMLLLEFASVGLIIILVFIYFAHSGHLFDPPQFSLSGTSSQSLRMALVLALFSYVGFESATALGEEAKAPLHTIPRSVLFSVLTVGVFFTAMAYTLVLAFRDNGLPLDKSASPLLDLANFAKWPMLGIPLAIGALIGQAACTLACVNAAARVMYSMSLQGFFPGHITKVHRTHGTPHFAVAVTSVIAGLSALILLARGIAVMDIFGYLGSISTFGFLFSYVLVSVAAPVYLRKRNELKIKDVIGATGAVFLLLIPIVGSVYPIPDPPYNILPYIFLGLMALGVAWVFWASKKIAI